MNARLVAVAIGWLGVAGGGLLGGSLLGCGPSARAPGPSGATSSASAAVSASAPPASASASAAALPDPPWPEPPRRDDLRAVGEARVVRGHAGGRYRVRTWTSDPAAYADPGAAPVGLVVCAEQREADGAGGKAAGSIGVSKAAGPVGASRPSEAAGAAGGAARAAGGASGAEGEGPWLCLRRGSAGWGHGVQLPGQAGWSRQGVLGDCAGCHDAFAR